MPPTLALYLPAAAPLLAALLALALPWRPAAWSSVAAALAILASGIMLAGDVTSSGVLTHGLLRADALTAFMIIVIGAVATIACWAGVQHLHHETTTTYAAATRRYLVLTELFLACMSLAVLADNLGLLWVAIEATTIVTAFLVGHRRTRASVEAAWKYVVLCSVGIAIAFLGTVCVYAAAVATGAHGTTALNWTYLSTHTGELSPDLVRLAAGLVLLGFGTKAGLAPMHSWLPDAHSQAPAPVSALMSGVLLSVAFYAILRYRTIANDVLGDGYTRTLLIIAALASLAVAATLLIAQRDYKRLLAYSSIEHMGLIALATAIGTQLALAAALLHILGHGLAKATAFCSAGRVLQLTASPHIDAVRGLAARQPALAATFGLSIVALLGFPPFSLFASELGIARSGLTAHSGWLIAVAFALTLIAFVAITRHASAILLGTPTTTPTPTTPAAGVVATPATILAPLTLGLVAVAVLGLFLGPLQPLLDAAAVIAGGH
jgi:hydrogenase-4 component F